MKQFLVALSVLGLVACGEMNQAPAQRVLSWTESKELIVLVQNSPTTFYVDAEGKYAGLEFDLVTRFAQENDLKLRFVVSRSYADMLARMKRHEAHLAVSLHQHYEGEGLAFGPAYQDIEPVLVYSARWNEAQARKMVMAGEATIYALPQYQMALNGQKVKHPALTWQLVSETDDEGLIEQVSQGQIDFAMVGSHAADVAQNYYPQIAISRKIAPAQQLSWAVQAEDAALLNMADRFFKSVKADGSLRRLMDRYYAHVNRVDPIDALAYLGHIQSTLPRYRNWFQQAEQQTNTDWRLIAALSYQESQWDPDAVSPTGVRGMMMLTNDTAKRLDVDRLDPRQSIMGGARYIQTLRETISEQVPEPDRTWMALAAYNVGLGHLLDARSLALRLNKNPDSWADLKTVLPLLRKPEYFSTLKYGYARGGEPVIFVERLKSYYDILARFEKPMNNSNPQLAESVVVFNPDNLQLDINKRAAPTRAPEKVAALY